MKKFLIVFLLFGFVLDMPAYAINVATGARAWWGYDGGTGTNGTAGDFIIAGTVGKSGTHGTHNDEWAVVGMVANQIVEHGGYFCPYQVQCANKRKKRRAWTQYYQPNGFSTSKCAWLCEPGYSGANCLSQTSTPARCDMTPLNTGSGGKFSGISMKTWGGDENQREWEIVGFNQWGDNPETDVILGVVKFLEHGVIAGPVQIRCGRDNWKSIDSFVESVNAATGTQKLLCATGYTANSAGSDCVPISADACATQDMTFCANFPRDGYNSTLHTIDDDTGGCVKYFCSESGKAFPSLGSTECVECSTGIKGGPNPNNGVCVTCETGQAFDKKSGACVSAGAYTKTDLQYGKGKTKNSDEDVEKQCWTKTTPEEYSDCVKGVSSSNTISSNVVYKVNPNLTINGQLNKFQPINTNGIKLQVVN